MFVSCTEHENRSAKYAVLNILIARVQGRIKRYRGGGRKGDGLRCEGGGGGGEKGDWETTKKYGWPTNVTTKSINKHNNNNFLNTRFTPIFENN